MSLKSLLRQHVGLWPLHEARNRTLGWRSAVAGYLLEQSELQGVWHVDVPRAKVATIIPTYGRPELVQRAVASALAQSVLSHVVIVVSDGPDLPPLPDDPRVVGVALSRNTGRPGIVRNVGMGMTWGRRGGTDFVAFLDDDNEWEPNHLEVALAALARGADLVYTDVVRAGPDGVEVDRLSRPWDRRAFRDETPWVDMSAVVMRNDGSRFSRLMRSRETLPGEDWELVYRLSAHKVVAHVPVPTVRYLVNPASYFTAWA